MRAKILLLTALIGTAFSAGAANAQNIIVTHHLRVAANPSTFFNDKEAQSVITSMNELITHRYYPWDAACAGVKFEFDGPVFTSAKLATNGTYEQLAKSLSDNAPGYNVLVVRGVSCQGITAAGCGPQGGEPMIVADQWPTVNDITWVHERGHNVKLPHSAEASDPPPSSDAVSKRIMFWHEDIANRGKTDTECTAYRDILYASETRSVDAGTHAPAIIAEIAMSEGARPSGAPAGEVVTAQAAAPPGQAADNFPDFEKLRTEMIKASGLTPRAFSVVGQPWTEGPPLALMKTLNQEDIKSIRAAAAGPGQYQAQAVQTLGYVGTSTDAKLLSQPLTSPMPAVPPGDLDQATVQQLRWAAASKQASIEALGLLAARTKSPDAINTLATHLDLSTASIAFGPDVAASSSKNTLLTISRINLPQTKQIVESAIQATNRAKAAGASADGATAVVRIDRGHTVTIPLLSDSETAVLRANVLHPPTL